LTSFSQWHSWHVISPNPPVFAGGGPFDEAVAAGNSSEDAANEIRIAATGADLHMTAVYEEEPCRDGERS
jgi:hypothetical protein